MKHVTTLGGSHFPHFQSLDRDSDAKVCLPPHPSACLVSRSRHWERSSSTALATRMQNQVTSGQEFCQLYNSTKQHVWPTAVTALRSANLSHVRLHQAHVWATWELFSGDMPSLIEMHLCWGGGSSVDKGWERGPHLFSESVLMFQVVKGHPPSRDCYLLPPPDSDVTSPLSWPHRIVCYRTAVTQDQGPLWAVATVWWHVPA